MPTLRRPTLPFSRMPSPRWSAGALQSDWLRDVLNPPVNRERCTMGRRLDGPSADWTPCWSAPDEVLCSGQWAMAGKDVDVAQGSAADDKEAWGFRIKRKPFFAAELCGCNSCLLACVPACRALMHREGGSCRNPRQVLLPARVVGTKYSYSIPWTVLVLCSERWGRWNESPLPASFYQR